MAYVITAAVTGTGVNVAKNVYDGITGKTAADALKRQQDALLAAQRADAQEAAAATTNAAVAANAKLADAKRRRMASTLATGAGDQTLAGPGTVLAAGATGQVSRSTTAASASAVRNASVLAGGAV